MRIEVKGRNVTVPDELRESVQRRFDKVSRQVSDLAVLEVELWEDSTPGTPERYAAEATLHLKGTSLRAKDNARDFKHAINLLSEDMSRQVKRHRDKRRARREARAAAARPGAPIGEASAPPGSLPAM
jgi:putative sigma-54 modulation protein